MNTQLPLILLLTMLTILANGTAKAQDDQGKIVRLARLQIDPAQLESYRTALAQEIAASVRVEPGVIALSAVAEKHDPTRITILEVYASEEAYQAHLQAPHFKQYKADTLHVVKSLELVEVEPVFLGTKAK